MKFPLTDLGLQRSAGRNKHHLTYKPSEIYPGRHKFNSVEKRYGVRPVLNLVVPKNSGSYIFDRKDAYYGH
jgi:hypothetical protein